MAYLIDEAGAIAHNVTVGVEPILNLMAAWDGLRDITMAARIEN